MDAELRYAYAVVRPSAGLDERVLAGVRGVANAPVSLVRSGAEVAAAVSPVPRADFTEAALKVRLENLDWLETTARAHHSVIEALAAHTTVLPLRLATVYLDDARVSEMLSERQETFTALLDRFSDSVEWGVKVYADARPAEPPPSAVSGPADEQDPGRAYLRRRRHQHQAREDAWRFAQEAAHRIEIQARDLAVERARHRPQQGGLAVAEGENVVNDAYLVPARLAEEFRGRMRHIADDLPGVRVDVTGPWAPYSFAVLPASGTQQGAPQR